METRNVVLALIGILILLVTLLVGLLSGCVLGGLLCSCFTLSSGTLAGLPGPVYPTPPAPPAGPVIPTPGPPVRPVPDTGRAGALITEVVPGSPADQAGLRPGDLILRVDRQSVGPTQDLKQIISKYRPGEEVNLTIWRLGRTESVRVRLAEHPEERGRAYLGLYYRLVGGGRLQSPSLDD